MYFNQETIKFMVDFMICCGFGISLSWVILGLACLATGIVRFGKNIFQKLVKKFKKGAKADGKTEDTQY